MTSALRLALILFATIPALFSALARGGEPDPWTSAPFTVDPRVLYAAAAATPAPSDQTFHVLLEEGTFLFDDAGRLTYKHHLVLQVLAPAGVQEVSSYSAGWDPWHQERPSLRARVISPAGVEHYLDPATIDESPSPSLIPNIFTDSRILRAPLPALAVGDLVEQEVVVRDTSPAFDAGTVNYFHFGGGTVYHRTRLIVEAPSKTPLRVVARLLEQARKRREEKAGRVRFTFEADRMEPLDPIEPNLPPEIPRQPYVAFSTGRSWEEVARAYGRIVDDQIGAVGVKGHERHAAAGGGTPAETAERILSRLRREIRYTGVEFGSASIVPRSPAETLQRKYGDCKDQATLVAALLRDAGLDSRVALLRTGPSMEIESDLPGLGVFDHAIVYVAGVPDLWIDPSDPFARAGELPAGDQGRLALVTGPGAASLSRTPEASSSDNRIVETREFYLSEKGPARVVETTQAWGEPERRYRSEYHATAAKEARDRLEAYVESAYLAAGLASYEHVDPLDLAVPFRLRLDAERAARGTTDDAEAAVAILLGPLFEPFAEVVTSGIDETEADPLGGAQGEFPSHPRRKADLVMSEPYVAEWRYRITSPPGYAVRDLPKTETAQIGPASLSREFAEDPNGVITAILKFDSGSRRITPDEVEAARKGLAVLREIPTTIIYFDQVGEGHLSAGRLRDAMEEFRQLERLHPAEALHRVQISRTLLLAGLGDAARDEARSAVTLEPSSAVAHHGLGWALQHDALGRRFGKGWDLPGAEASLRRAKALDPSEVEFRGDLAILLEHNASGERYGSGARLDEAIAEYRALREDREDLYLDQNLLIAMMRAERFTEMETFARSLETSPEEGSLLLTAVAAGKGAGAALREAPRLAPDAEIRRQSLIKAGLNLALLRRYPVAGELFSEAARLAPNADSLLPLISLVRKARRFEDLPFDDTDPRSIVQRVLMLAVIGGLEDPANRGLLSSVVRATLNDEQAGRTLRKRIARGATSSLAGSGLSPISGMEIGFAGFQFDASGSNDVGYRVSMSAPSIRPGLSLAIYLIREDGALRIRSAAGDLEGMGQEALHRVESGDLAGARQWLDWAAEERFTAAKDGIPAPNIPFPELWKGEINPKVDRIRCAAASLAASGEKTSRALALLEECRERAGSDAERVALDLALARTYASLRRFSALAPVAERLSAVQPPMGVAFTYLAGAYVGLRRWDDLRRVSEERLAMKANDADALRALAVRARWVGAASESKRHLRRLVDLGLAGPEDYNNLAWGALFEEPFPAEALEDAERAVAASGAPSGAAFHTLASVYAEVGKLSEAYASLLRAIDADGLDAPEPHHWYVIGRIAEGLGLREAAVAAYGRVASVSDDEPPGDSTYALAQRRLRILG